MTDSFNSPRVQREATRARRWSTVGSIPVAIEWTGFSPELLVPLDRNLAEPLRSQLESGLRDAIRSGRLRAGERLPSTRELAR